MSYEKLLSPECPYCEGTGVALTRNKIHRDHLNVFFEEFFCYKCSKSFYVNVCTGKIFKEINTEILYISS